jgi:hypothetical protein
VPGQRERAQYEQEREQLMRQVESKARALLAWSLLPRLTAAAESAAEQWIELVMKRRKTKQEQRF